METVSLTLKQLSCFLAVAETCHFRRAAERCGISQPSLSAQIQNLESVLGVQLVERSRSGVALTPIGREVADRARAVGEQTQGIVDLAVASQGGLIGTIKLGTSQTIGPYLMPYVVSSLHREHRDLRLYVREGAPRDLQYELGQGTHDVCLTQLPATSSELVSSRLFREPLYLTLTRDHPLADKPSLTVADLAGLEVLSLSPQYHLHDQVAGLCETFGAHLQRDYEGNSLDAIRQMVGMGMGVAFLPALYVHSEIQARSEVVVKDIRGRSITRAIGMVWRKSAGRARSYKLIADAVRDVAKAKFNDLIVEGS
ncbi:MAG: hydrogen peroxide-inducible genes activator [Pseudomonadota bacterium]